MMRLRPVGLIAAVTLVLVLAPRLAWANAVFTLPPSLNIDPSSTGFFLVSVTTDTAYQVRGFTVDVVLTPVASATGLTFTGAANDTSASYVLSGNSTTLNQGSFDTTTNQGGASNASSPLFVSDPAGTYTMIQVDLATTPAATDSYTVSFVNSAIDNELTVTSGGLPSNLAATITSTATITVTPEPATLLLLAPAAGLVALRRRRRHG
jgi:hypothetical protein